MKINITSFGGMLPRLLSHQLPEINAQSAHNVFFDYGALDVLAGPGDPPYFYLFEAAETIYRFGAVPADDESGHWFRWGNSGLVSVVRGPFKGDTQERTYFTGAGWPQVTDATIATAGNGPYPANSYLVGVPAPASSPNLTDVGLAGAAENKILRAYVVTYVNAWGEEGPPSDPTSFTETWVGNTVIVSNIPTGPAGDWNLVSKNIYRTATGQTTEFDFVVNIPLAQTSYNDSKLDQDLGVRLQSTEWYPPPNDMQGIGVLPNGILYGFSGDRVCFSEAWLPHAWSPNNQVELPYKIVGGGSFDNTLVVLTGKNPVLISGADPASMTSQEIQLNAGCLSRRSIVSTSQGVIYAAPQGLILIGPNGYQILTEAIYHQDQWIRNNSLTTMLGVVHRDKYIAFMKADVTKGRSADYALIFDLKNPGLGVIESSYWCSAAYSDPLLSDLYVIYNDALCVWRGATDSPSPYVWRSRKYVFGKPATFVAARVLADAYPVTMNVYCGGVIRYSGSVANAKPFRLPAGYQSEDIEVELAGTTRIIKVELATSMSEMALP